MKQRIFLFTILVMALVVAGCTQPTPSPQPALPTFTATPPELAPTLPPQDDSWAKVQQAGVLRVGTTADYPPFEYYNENAELDGFDIALIQQIGQRLGLRVELNDFAFDTLPTAVSIGQVDVAIGALSVTPERQAVANFSNVYYASSDAVLSRPEADPNKVKDTAALAVVRLGVHVNSIYQTYAQEKLINTGLMPIQNLRFYSDISTAVNELKANLIDAVWLDLKPAQEYAGAGDVKILVQDMNQQLYAIGMKKGADSLRDKINEVLTQLQNDGTLANLQVEYLGIRPEDVVPPQPPPTPIPQPTPVPPTCVDNAEHVKDLTYDDNNHKNPPVLNPGEAFTKGWRMRNIGSCTWSRSYVMAYSSGNVSAAQMGGQPIPVTKDVKPGDTFDFQVNLIAPVVPGSYQGYWNLRNNQNTKFGETVWVDIKVTGKATPTPHPTQTPVPNVVFEADPTTITEGDEVHFEWNTENAKFVYFYHDGQKWSEHPVEDDGEATEYPPYSMNYYLHVEQRDGVKFERRIWITVNPATDVPKIEYFTASPPQITVGQSVSIDWSVSGKVDQVNLIIDNITVLENTALKGNYQHLPQAAGTHVYTLQAFGPGGKNTQQTSVNVQVPPPTQTPVPEVPTPTPIPPTLEPTTPPEPLPPVIDDFSVSPTTIEQGQSVTASWSTSGGTTRVELLRENDVIWADTQLNNSLTDTPPQEAPYTIIYTLIAYNNAEESETSEAIVEIVPAPPQNSLANTTWQLGSMEGAGDIPPEVSITAYFSEAGSLSGSGGCNSYNTSYSADGQAISIQFPGTTEALCGEPADSLERMYLELLPQAANFEIKGDRLIILGNGGQEILQYRLTG